MLEIKNNILTMGVCEYVLPTQIIYKRLLGDRLLYLKRIGDIVRVVTNLKIYEFELKEG